ncbi:2,3-bisphosphoglycerate-dependent phosphoglycerate mutase [Palaeococcus ferrophilus]|uniref:2,3-bisphosphoglycerate-dependent phosphoglycerate mutase n=1 Tax=Palaeococcus ferrophilus TaxID=83868 RepID=UPI00064F17AB|nr:2,3-bisphosphoglycerate-dependent phosphoglycerate mutase [Palaeococcus ferrophilus]
MSRLVLVRHGESLWNKLNLFTGWVDVPLSERGIDEALRAGELLKDWKFEVVFTSELVRAISTATLIMAKNKHGVAKIVHEGRMGEWGEIHGEDGKNVVPVYRSWHLNERYYGKLQGWNKDRAREVFGAERVHLWRRSYDVAPPGGESLKDTAARTVPFFRERILPALNGGNVLVSAHGNSLRSIVMHIEGLTREEVLRLNIPTGVPLVYDYVDGRLKRLGYLGEKGYDPDLKI